MSKRKSIAVLFVGMMILLLVLSACSAQDQPDASAGGGSNQSVPEDNSKKGWPEVLHYSVVPGESQESLAKTFEPVVEDLSEALGMEVEFYIPTDYTAVIEAMRTQKVDVAEFGPFSYIIANERSGAEAFAVAAKSPEEAFYTSVIIVPDESPAKTLDDLKGKKFLFVDPASTSGNLFPHVMLAKHFGLKTADEVDKLFSSVSFSGGHDASALAIAKGDADGAAVSSSSLKRFVDKGLLKDSDYKVIAESSPIPVDPITYRKDLPEDLKQEIKDFFLSYQNEEIFAERGINGYFPIEDSDYDIVRETAEILNMSPEELLK